MARTRAVMFCEDFGDDFNHLPAMAQWLYTRLLMQPKLSLAGVLVMQPGRWATLAPDADVAPALAALTEAGWIAVDSTTDELLMVRHLEHDVCRGNLPENTVKGVWSAWAAIESPILRALLVEHVPAKLWDRSETLAPSSAQEMRRSAPIERADATARVDGPTDQPEATVHPIRPSPPPPPSPSPATRPIDPSDALPAEVIQTGRAAARAIRSTLAVGAGATSAEDVRNG